MASGLQYSAELRCELSDCNAEFLENNPAIRGHKSHGGVQLYCPSEDGKRHGNFIDASYRAILQCPDWAARLAKPHTAKRALPQHPAGGRWAELDSSMSSDALLMNIFCYPGVCSKLSVTRMLGIAAGIRPEFGHHAGVPLLGNRVDRTEVDMRLGDLLVESKLTEADFQTQSAKVVAQYRDLEAVFDVNRLPRRKEDFASYQLVRNVLAAYASGSSFCVMVDQRRGDLIRSAGEIFGCVRDAALRTRCKLLTWQELARALPTNLQRFLAKKYGIVVPQRKVNAGRNSRSMRVRAPC